MRKLFYWNEKCRHGREWMLWVSPPRYASRVLFEWGERGATRRHRSNDKVDKFLFSFFLYPCHPYSKQDKNSMVSRDDAVLNDSHATQQDRRGERLTPNLYLQHSKRYRLRQNKFSGQKRWQTGYVVSDDGWWMNCERCALFHQPLQQNHWMRRRMFGEALFWGRIAHVMQPNNLSFAHRKERAREKGRTITAGLVD